MTREPRVPLDRLRGACALYGRLLRYVRAERSNLAMMVSAMLVATVLMLAQPWPLQIIVDSVLNAHEAPAWLIAAVGEQSPMTLLGLALGAMLLLLLLRQAVAMAQTYYSQVFGQRMVFALRCDIYTKLQRLAVKFHDYNPVGDLTYRVTEDASALQDVVVYGLVPFAIQFLTAAAVIGAIFMLDTRLGMAALLMIPLLVIWTVWFSERVRRLSHGLARAESDLCTRVNETLGSIRAVKAFGMEEFEVGRFQQHARTSQAAYINVVLHSTIGTSGTELLAGVGTIVVVLVGALSVVSGRITVGELLVFMAYVQNLFGPVTQLAATALVVQRSRASVERVMEILDQDDEHLARGHVRPTRVAGRVRFEDVSFSYDGVRPILHHVGLEIPPGQTVALVGPSGAGKTTLIALLVRFYEASAGRILVDGFDIRTMDLQALRRHIALVMQEPIIFSCSLQENIAYGRPGATFADIERASQAAGMHDFIMGLPDTYDTTVGERGVRLSGGQRQRLSIARAFLKDAAILVLDEPTSHLDTTTEQQIFDALGRLALGRTTIYIAHRLTTAQRADRIVVLNDGRIVEQGTHAGLLAGAGLYKRLVEDQHRAPRPWTSPVPMPTG